MAKKSYRFATFNLLNYAEPLLVLPTPRALHRGAMANKSQFISGMIQHINPDIIVFQEVFTPDSLQILCEDLGLVHFATVDSPTPDHIYPNVLFQPVVAIASRYPFRSFAPLEPCPELLEYLNNQHQFRFNRTPIKCKFDIPDLVYWPVMPCILNHSVCTLWRTCLQSSQDDPLLTLLHETVGTMQTQISRSLEASVIYYDALKTQREKQAATLVMGDFNDAIDSPALSFMNRSFPTTVNANQFDSVGLFDSFLYADNTSESKPPTHFYQGKGNVLDYILCSKEFNPNCPNSAISGLRYYSYDSHLDPKRVDEDICYSDHGANSNRNNTVR